MENNSKEMMEKGYPLMLVFYMDRELMASEVMRQIAASINDALALREANAMAFFVPTDGVERIECINPVQVKEADMSEVYNIVKDLTNNFDIGKGADDGKNNPENEIEIERTEDNDEQGLVGRSDSDLD